MTDLAQPPPITGGAVDAAGLVAADVPCRRCSYNLKGLSPAGRCPECGAPVGVAVHGDLLRYGDPQWLRGLSKGAALAFWGVFVSGAVTVAGGIVAAMTVPLVAPLADLAGGLMYLYGAWLLTEPDPSGLGEDKYGRARQVIRVALLVGLVDSAIGAVHATAAPPPEVAVALHSASFVTALADLVGELAMLRYLERLALRIPDGGLSRTARVVFWGYGISLAVMVVMGGIVAVVGFSTGSFGAGAPAPRSAVLGVLAGAGCLAGAAGLAWAGFAIAFLVLLFQLKRAFAQQAELAAEVWSGERLVNPVDPGQPLATPPGKWGKMPQP